jgi:hypothetical protein
MGGVEPGRRLEIRGSPVVLAYPVGLRASTASYAFPIFITGENMKTLKELKKERDGLLRQVVQKQKPFPHPWAMDGGPYLVDWIRIRLDIVRLKWILRGDK